MALATEIVTAHPASRIEQMLRLGFRYRSRTHDGQFEGIAYERVLSGMLRVAVLVDAVDASDEPRRFAAPRWEIASRDIHGAWQLVTSGHAATIEVAALEATTRAEDSVLLAMRLVETSGQFASMLSDIGSGASDDDRALGRARRLQ